MMELRRLKLLHELAGRGTIAAVAEALSYSPSSVSAQLAELEREAGAKLLRRAGRNVELTQAGRRLAEHAARTLEADEAILAELTALSDAPRGVIRMTFVQTPALALLPTALSELERLAPGLQVEVVHLETGPALEALRSRAVDIVVGIEYDPVPTPRHRDVDRRNLMTEDVLITLPPKDPLARGRKAIDLATLEDRTWAVGNPGTGHSAIVEHVCNRLGGYAPDIRHRTDDGLILRALVSSGRAITLLPALIATATPRVAARPIAAATVQRVIFTAVRRSAAASPALETTRHALLLAAEHAAHGRTDTRVVAQ